MKLLRKPEIIALKEREKAREIVEGVKVARKVDELRELQANTEKKLSDFRDSSLRVIQGQIETLGVQRDHLVAEVSSLQKKLDAMLPGMETKREELYKKEKELTELSNYLNERDENIRFAEIDILEVKKELSDSLLRQQTNELVSKRASLKAEEAKAGALSSLSRAKITLENTEKEKQKIEVEIAEKQAKINFQVKELNEKAKELDEERKKLEQEKVKLAYRNAMLNRTLERLKKQRINVG